MQSATLLLDASWTLPDIPLVEAEFTSLEEKVAQFVSLCERLRAENNDLKRELAALRNDAKRLHDKINSAKARLEGLLARLPG